MTEETTKGSLTIPNGKLIGNDEKFTNVLKRDKKHVPYSGFGGFVKLVGNLIIKLPILVGIILFVEIVYLGVSAIMKPCKSSGPKGVDDGQEELEKEITIRNDAIPHSERKFDVVLFGVTGFTGFLMARHLATTYGVNKSVKWAIAGRKKSALEKVKERLVSFDPECANLEIIIADSFDDKSLEEMCANTKAVASTVGPFMKYGERLVRTCIAFKTNYVDSTGEGVFVRAMIEKYQKQAQEAKVKIVSFTGNDCIPYDLSVMTLSNLIKQINPEDSLERVELFDDLNAAASGGTIGTMIYHLTEHKPQKSNLGFNPMDMDTNGEKAARKIKSAISHGPGYSSTHGSWYTFFVLSIVNKECVRRSNVFNEYSDKITYKEQMVLPNFGATISWVIENIITGIFLTNSWFRNLAFGLGLLPKPGMGPKEKDMVSGYLNLTTYGFGKKGTKASCQLYFPKDPGYMETGRMVSESALCLALDGDSLPETFGILTPAAGLGDQLMKRLIDTGCELEVKASH